MAKTKAKKRATKKLGGRIYSALGIVSAVLSLLAFSGVFGLLAVILGYTGYSKGDKKLGTWAMVLGVVLAILGVLLGRI